MTSWIIGRRSAVVLATTGAVALGAFAALAVEAEAAPTAPYTVGVANNLKGNGWREEMICSIKAQALVSGKVDKVIAISENHSTQQQINDIRSLISQGADIILINPSDRDKLNATIRQATAKGIIVVAVDQGVSEKSAYVVANDQVAYGRLGAEALFKKMGGKGNVVEMRGFAGVPADTDRHTGFNQALKKYPNIKVVKSVFTDWNYTKGGQQARDLLTSGVSINGIWTSGIDYTVAEAFKTAKKPLVPIVGADNNGFLKQLATNTPRGVTGSVVTNPAVVGAVGLQVALDALAGKNPKKSNLLTPEVWDSSKDKAKIQASIVPGQGPTYVARTQIAPWTKYTTKQLTSCVGPGE